MAMSNIDYSARYDGNMPMLSPAENAKLREFKVCIVGCGSLGGNVANMLARMGIGELTIIDGGRFSVSDLNRQVFCTEDSIGEFKAQAAKDRIAVINSDIKINAITKNLTEENRYELISGHDIVIDSQDNMSVRRNIYRACEMSGLTMVHGAVSGWFGQVSTMPPGDETFEKIYPAASDRGGDSELGTPSFTSAFVASLQAAEAIKVLLTKGVPLTKRMLTVDLLLMEIEIFNYK